MRIDTTQFRSVSSETLSLRIKIGMQNTSKIYPVYKTLYLDFQVLHGAKHFSSAGYNSPYFELFWSCKGDSNGDRSP